MTADRSQRRLRSALVAAEVALALMLVSGTALLLKSFVNLINVDTGFRSDGVMVLQMFAWDRNPGPGRLRVLRPRRRESRHFRASRPSARCRRCRSSNRTSTSAARCGCSINRRRRPGDEIRALVQHRHAGLFPGDGRARRSSGRLLDDRDGPRRRRSSVISEAFAERYLRGRRSDRAARRVPRLRARLTAGRDRRRRARAAPRAAR